MDELHESQLTPKAMELVLEDFQSERKELRDQMASMLSEFQSVKAELSEERKLRKSAERKLANLQEKYDHVRQERFGDRRQLIRKNTEKPESDREDEKDKFDGTSGTCRENHPKVDYPAK